MTAPKGIYIGGGRGYVEIDADDVRYEPQTPGNWPAPPPDNVGAALDELAASGGSGALPRTEQAVLGGQTKTAAVTDTFIGMDSSNGLQPIIKLYATPHVGLDVTIRWIAYNGAMVPPLIDGNGNQVTGYADGVLAATTTINTPLGFITYKFTAAGWQQSG